MKRRISYYALDLMRLARQIKADHTSGIRFWPQLLDNSRPVLTVKNLVFLIIWSGGIELPQGGLVLTRLNGATDESIYEKICWVGLDST